MRLLVRLFERIRRITGLKAHHLETIFAAAVLVVVAMISRKGVVEWIGVFGVIFTFEYQVLSTYLREHIEATKRKRAGVRMHMAVISKEVQVLYYLKECVWIAYFLFFGGVFSACGYGNIYRVWSVATPVSSRVTD